MAWIPDAWSMALAAGAASGLWWFLVVQPLRQQHQQCEQALQQQRLEQAAALAEAQAKHTTLQAQLQWVNDQQQSALTQWEAQMKAFMLQQGDVLKQSLEQKADREWQEKHTVFSQHITQLVNPLHETLRQYQYQVLELDKTRSGQNEVIHSLHGEVRRLATALSSNKGRGDWGELQLTRLLEASGLLKGVHYELQAAYEGGKKRPDVKIMLSDDRHVFVDAKALQVDVAAEADEALTPEQRKARGLRYVQSLKEATKLLSSKEYQLALPSSASFVVLYVPQESMLSLALLEEPGLMQEAWDKGVMLAGPLNLMAMLRMIHQGWRMAIVSEKAEAVLAMGQKLHSQASVVADRLNKVGRSIEGLTQAFNGAVTAWDGQQGMVRQIRKLEEYGCSSEKTLPDEIAVPETPAALVAPVV
ncbi:MAG: DNA recombination protein RmuC [Vampirovibrionales bacterium]